MRDKFKIWSIIMGFMIVPFFDVQAFAIQNSQFFKGTEKLLTDAASGLTTLVTLVGIAALIYFAIRKAVADEMDHKKWDTRMIVAIVCVIIGLSAKVLIEMFSGYYK